MKSPAVAVCAEFRVRADGSDDGRAAVEVGVSVVGFVVAWAAAAAAFSVSKGAALATDVVVAVFLVRLFVLQHDAGHGALFSTRAKNDLFGTLVCIPLLTPYLEWRKSHAIHHKISSQLDHRIFPDIYTVTLDEYRGFETWKKIAYRVFRHPLVIFGVVPAYFFFISCRIKGSMCPTLPRGRHLVNLWLTTVGATALFGGLGALIGFERMLWVWVPSQLLGGAVGFWLFYVGHQAEHTWWAHDDRWTYEEAGLKGATFFDLPRPLAWATAWVGIHHVHHLDPKVPCFRLREAHEALVDKGLFTSPVLSLGDGLRCTRLALWDEQEQRLVGF